MQIEIREYKGYQLEGKPHAGQYQVHVYPIDRSVPWDHTVPVAIANDKETSFKQAQSTVDDLRTAP